MCWNEKVSLYFALAEIIMMTMIAGRVVWISKYYSSSSTSSSSSFYIRQQVWILPMLLTIVCVELIEHFLWKDDETLLPIEDAIAMQQQQQQVHDSVTTNTVHTTCSTYNHRLTLFIGLGILPWQPFWLLYAFRRVRAKHEYEYEYERKGPASGRRYAVPSSSMNWIRYEIPERMAFIFGMFFVSFYVVAHKIIDIGYWSNYLQRHIHPLQLVMNSGDGGDGDGSIGYYNIESCTYRGVHGHLHWTFAMPDTYLTPNAMTYHLLFLSSWMLGIGRSDSNGNNSNNIHRLFTYPAMMIHVLFALLLIWMGPTFEIGSIWCWTGGFLHLYLLLQPYLLPIQV